MQTPSWQTQLLVAGVSSCLVPSQESLMLHILCLQSSARLQEPRSFRHRSKTPRVLLWLKDRKFRIPSSAVTRQIAMRIMRRQCFMSKLWLGSDCSCLDTGHSSSLPENLFNSLTNQTPAANHISKIFRSNVQYSNIFLTFRGSTQLKCMEDRI